MSGFKTIEAGANPLASDVNQLVNAFSGTADVGALVFCASQSTPTAPSVSPTGVGLLNGQYYYKTVLITGWKQSDGSYFVSGFAPSASSTQVTIANGQGNVIGIALGATGTIGRAIYRTLASGAAGTEKFALVIWDNATNSYIDNVADGNLGSGVPSSLTNPAAYGVAIPSTVPTLNTTGTTLSVPSLDASTLDGLNSTDFMRTIGGVFSGTVDHQRNIVYKPKFLNYSEVHATNATATGAVTIDMNLGNNHILILTGNTTLTISNAPPNLPSGQTGTFTLIIIQGATPRTITYPASFRFMDDIQPDISVANKIYFLTFVTLDGGTKYYNLGSALRFS